MATTFKALAVGSIATSNSTTTIYTTPASSKTIIKSFIITNGSAGNVMISVRMANIEILFNYIMKPNDTIIVPVMDQLLVAGNTITIYASAGNSISYYISGIDTLTSGPEYADVVRMGLGYFQSENSTIVTSSTKNRLVKGVILCNTGSADLRVYMSIAGYSLLQGFMVKGYDTILVPTTDLLLPASTTISAYGYGMSYYITGKELG